MSDFDTQIQMLIEKGVKIPHPHSVYISDDVDPARIAAGVTLHPGCRLQGASTSIGPGSVIGEEGPATVIDCQLGARVSLKGGYFEGSVFLDDASVGSSAHVRPGCLLEEEACAAHAVGLKQTILFPFVTLGSLINFCDILMSGGTSRKNHSEVGSSFIHFNFTPHGDKATASMIGEVSRGVLLNQPPIFLGGQGGIVGPVEMAFGTVQAAGSICRHDLLKADHLYQSAVSSERYVPYQTGKIRDAEAKWRKNLTYIASLHALRYWYTDFRMPVMADDMYTRACLDGAVALLDGSVKERLKQLEKWVGICENAAWQKALISFRQALAQPADVSSLNALCGCLDLESAPDMPYTGRIQHLHAEQQTCVQHFFEQEINRLTVSAATPEGD